MKILRIIRRSSFAKSIKEPYQTSNVQKWITVMKNVLLETK